MDGRNASGRRPTGRRCTSNSPPRASTKSRLIASTINELASTQLWINLTPKQREAIEKVGHVVIADLNKQREAARRAEMEALEPLR